MNIIAWAFLITACSLLGLHFSGLQQLPWPFLIYAGMSLLSYTLYKADKTKARQQQRRISEGTLYLIDALGGWPGGLIAQKKYRHKTKKVSFRLFFWGIVLAHGYFWYWWLHILGCGFECSQDQFMAWLIHTYQELRSFYFGK